MPDMTEWDMVTRRPADLVAARCPMCKWVIPLNRGIFISHTTSLGGTETCPGSGSELQWPPIKDGASDA